MSRRRRRFVTVGLVGGVPVLLAVAAALAWGSSAAVEAFAAVVARTAPIGEEAVLIRAVRIADLRSWRTVALSDLRVRSGRIAAIAPSGSLAAAPGERVIEGAGRTLTRGLVDARSEIVFRDPLRRMLPPEVARDSLRAQVRSGVTAVRDLGSPLAAAGRLRRALGAGLVGPAAVLGGPWLALEALDDRAVDPHRTALEELRLTSASEASRAIDALAQAGAAWVAVRPPPALDGPRTRERLDAIARLAAERGLKLAVRVIEESSLRWALSTRPGSIEELAGYPTELSADLVEQIAHSGAVVVPLAHLTRVREVGSNGEYELDKQTRWIGRASWWGELAHLDRAIRARHDSPVERERARARMEAFRSNLARLVAARVPIALGTGAPSAFAFPERPGDEIAELANAGLRGEALAEACFVAGWELVDGDEHAGAVALGAPANLVVWQCDPIEDPRCYQRPSWVVAAGRVLEGRTTQPARRFL